MKLIWKKVMAVVLCVAMMFAFLTGCSGGNAKTAANEKSIIRLSIEGDPEHLDESIVSYTTVWWTAAPVNDYLLEFDEKMNLQPSLLEEYNMTDELSLSFKLRKGIKFHNGREVVAKDVKWSIERHLDPALGSYLADSLTCIDSIEIVDDYSGIIHLKEPYAPFLTKLTKIAIVPEECADTLKTAPVGCGPFKFVSWEHDQKIVYEKNSDYWKEGYPKCDGLEFRILPEYNSQHSALLSGEIDILLWADNSDVETLDADENIYIREQPILDAYYVLYNCDAEPLNDPKVRRAISLVIDREAIIKSAMDGKASPVYAPVPCSSYYYDESLKDERNVEEAKKLLAEAGYPDGFTIRLLGPATAIEGKIVDLVQNELAEIGIVAQSEKQDVASFLDTMFTKKDFDIVVCGDSGDGDPETFAYNYLFSESGTNVGNYKNDEFDRLLMEGRTVYDKELRREVYLDAFTIIKEEAPMTFLCGGAIYSAIRSDVQGLNGYQTQKFDYRSVERVQK